MKRLFIGYATLTTLLLAVVFAASAGLITTVTTTVEQTPVAGPTASGLINIALASQKVETKIFSGQEFRFAPIAPLHLAGVSQRKPLDSAIEDYIFLVLRQNVANEFDVPVIEEFTDSSCTGVLAPAQQNPVETVIQMVNEENGVNTYAKDIFIPLMNCAASNNEQCEETLVLKGADRQTAEAVCRRDDAALNFVFYTLFDPAERVVWRYMQKAGHKDIPAYFCPTDRDETLEECGVDGSVAKTRGLHDLEDVNLYFQVQQFVYDDDAANNAGECGDYWSTCTPAGPSTDSCPQGQTCVADRNQNFPGRWTPLPLENDLVKAKLASGNVPYVYDPTGVAYSLNELSKFSADINGRLDLNNDTQNRGDMIDATLKVGDNANLPPVSVVSGFLKSVTGNPTGSVDLAGIVTHEAEGNWKSTNTMLLSVWPNKDSALGLIGDLASPDTVSNSIVRNKAIFVQGFDQGEQITLKFRPMNDLKPKSIQYLAPGDFDYGTYPSFTATSDGFIITSIGGWNYDPSQYRLSKNAFRWVLERQTSNPVPSNLEISFDNGQTWQSAYTNQ